jgi:hypothetical protein
MQLLPSLVAGLKAVCATFPDARKGRGGNIEISDFGVSAFSMFFMQSGSFLAYQRALETGQGRSNCQSLFGITSRSFNSPTTRESAERRYCAPWSK